MRHHVLLVVSLLCFFTISSAKPTHGSSGPIPSTFFGMSLNKASTVNTWPTIGTLGKDNSEDWGFVERSNGTFNWASTDADIAAAKSRGVNTFLYSMLVTPSWASSGGAKNAVPSVTDYDNYLRAFVTRYKGQIQYYELWNEPNNPKSWSGTVQDMLNLAKSAYPLIKSIDPAAIVLTPGVAVAGVEPITSGCMNICWLPLYLQAGGGDYADAITWHAYRCQTGQYGVCNYGIGCTEAIQCAGTPLTTQIGLIESYMAASGLSSKPLIDTEGGWGPNQYLPDGDQQAAYVARWYSIQASESVSIATWYAWNGDTLGDPTAYGTMWTPTQGESNAANAYEQTYDWLTGATFSAPCALSNSLWTCDITSPEGDQELMAWADSNSSTISYTPQNQFTQYQDLNGVTHQISQGSPIEISDKPILLVGASSTISASTTSTSTIPEFLFSPFLVIGTVLLVAALLLSRIRKKDELNATS